MNRSSSCISPITIYSQSSTIGYGSMRSSTSSIIDCQCTNDTVISNHRTIEQSIDSFYRNYPTSIQDNIIYCNQHHNNDMIDELEKDEHRSINNDIIDLDRVHPSIELQRRIDIELMAVNIIRMIDELRTNNINNDEHYYEQIIDDTDDIRMINNRTPPPIPNTRRRPHRLTDSIVNRLRTLIRNVINKKQLSLIRIQSLRH